MHRLLLSAALWLLIHFAAYAQRLSAYQLGNYAGTNGTYLNPSSIADSRWRLHINLATASFQASSQLKIPLTSLPLANADLALRGQQLVLKETDVRGPGVMVQLRSNKAFAITTRLRADLNVSPGANEVSGWLGGSKVPLAMANREVSLNTGAFSEVAFSYAMPVLDYQQHFVKVGGTYKYIRGIYSSTVGTNGQFNAPAGQLSYNLNGLQATYSDLDRLRQATLSDVLPGSGPGSGSGFDLGFTYEFRPRAETYRYPMDGKTMSDVTLTKYRLRFGVSLLDIGSIRYTNVSTWAVPPRIGTLQQTAVQPPKTLTDIRIAVAQSLGVAPEGSVGNLTVKLPQTLSMQLDAQLGKGWFAGVVWWKPVSSGPDAQHRAELLSFGPRYESKGSEFSVTGNYWQPLGKLSVGTHVRLGIFTFGTDNVLGFFQDNGLSVHAFAGVTLPFGAKRPADRDGDYVSNRRDLCPDLSGIWAFKGCPDTDLDGVQDKDDTCPEEKGPAATNGCPDADKDGIFDKNDACPNEFGTAKFNGCPDTDEDGIANKDDECPTVAGLPALGGCPDADADGLRDTQDACPTEWGLKELNGCALHTVARPTDASLSASENSLLDQLGQSWLRGPKGDSTALKTVQTYLTANAKRVIILDFSGPEQEPLLRVANVFKDELAAYFGDTKRFRFSVVVRANAVVGLRVGIKNE